MTTTQLIEAASVRLLSKDENARLVLGLWKGTRGDFIKAVNAAYASAKKYERFGGVRVHQELMSMFDNLGSSDFSVLYRAVGVARSEL